MIYETLHDGTKIDKIGFGTWRIGGQFSSNQKEDTLSLNALRSALDLGYKHFDTAEMYAKGHSEELLEKAIRHSKISREQLFITTKVLPSNLEYHKLKNAFENSLRRLKMDYVDLYLIHWPIANMALEDAFRAMNDLVNERKIRYLGVSNFSVDQMKRASELSESPLTTNQVPYNLSDRSYDQNGVLIYCQQNRIIVTAYSPVEEGRLKIDETLRIIAESHRATPYQIALAWIVQQSEVITIPMSFNPQHQAENLQAAQIRLTSEEMKLLDQIAK